jgi:hypothetical protein
MQDLRGSPQRYTTSVPSAISDRLASDGVDRGFRARAVARNADSVVMPRQLEPQTNRPCDFPQRRRRALADRTMPRAAISTRSLRQATSRSSPNDDLFAIPEALGSVVPSLVKARSIGRAFSASHPIRPARYS